MIGPRQPAPQKLERTGIFAGDSDNGEAGDVGEEGSKTVVTSTAQTIMIYGSHENKVILRHSVIFLGRSGRRAMTSICPEVTSDNRRTHDNIFIDLAA